MKHVLIVEDEDLFRELLCDSLRPNSPQRLVHAAESGRRAMELLREHTFDLIITDLCLPEVDGFALLAHLRELGSEAPAIAITGHTASGLEPLARSLGARVFFEKPFDFGMLGFTADRLLLADADTRLQGLSLQNFLQSMEKEGRTSLVSVLSCDARQGQLRVVKGKLVSALTDTAQGDAAVVEMLKWRDPEIRVSAVFEPQVPNMRTRLDDLLPQSAHGPAKAPGVKFFGRFFI